MANLNYFKARINSNNQANVMAKKRSGILPNLELLIIAIFFFGFVFWAISKCNATREQYRIVDEQEQQAENVEGQAETPAMDTTKPKPRETPRPQIVQERITPLYVIIDGLNMRKEPKLDSRVILRLALHDEVIYLNEKTSFTQEIDLGGIITKEPWLKVKTAEGRVGWVYGAYVHFYKKTLDIPTTSSSENE